MRILFAILMTLAMVASCCGDDHPFYVSDDAPFALTVGNDFPFDVPQAPDNQILAFVADWCVTCEDFKTVSAPALEKAGWPVGDYGMVRIVDVDEHPELFAKYDNGNGLPLAVQLRHGKEVRRIEPGCSLELDQWAVYWLWTAEHHPDAPKPKRLQTTVKATGGYPIRGNWWTVEELSNPTREKLIDHLDRASAHDDKFKRWWLESLSYAEMMSLHSADHEGNVDWRYVNQRPQERAASMTRRSNSAGRGLLRSIFTRRAYCPTCPN